jgi:hypothetical protein
MRRVVTVTSAMSSLTSIDIYKQGVLMCAVAIAVVGLSLLAAGEYA